MSIYIYKCKWKICKIYLNELSVINVNYMANENKLCLIIYIRDIYLYLDKKDKIKKIKNH
jgi:hypothetical protein